MKKPLDIGALVDEKFKTKSNKFGWNELLKEIENVLQEQGPYFSKFGSSPSDSIPENANQGQQIYNHAFGAPEPRNPISDGDKGFIPAEKLAEEDTETKKEAKAYTVQVPDIFSLISNSEMKPGSDDRKLIQRIVRNLQTEKGNWILRIQKINEFTQTASNPVQTKNIREAISALMFLNLLKKISFFVAQPGKLFEYILRPLIGTEATVLGSVDQQIVDVTKESQGKVWDYSLKMFTGKESSFTVKGSKGNLEEAVLKRGRPITYIIAVSNKEKRSIEFSECLISTIPEHLPAGEWQPIKIVADAGIVLVKDASVGILVQTENNLEKLSDYGSVPVQAPKEKELQQGPKLPKEKAVKVGNRNYTLENVNQELRNLDSNLELVKNTPNDIKIQYLSSVRPNTGMPIEEKDFKAAVLNILSILNNSSVPIGEKAQQIKILTIPNTKTTYGTNKDTILSDIIKIKDPQQKLQTISDILTKIGVHEAALKNAKEKLMKNDVVDQPQQPQAEIPKPAEEIELQEADQVEPEKKDKTQFSIGLKNIWQAIPNKIPLNLGNPEEYNKQQLTIASEVAENMSKALEAFQQLNINLVNFFATSKQEAKGGDYGNKAIENATTIATNVAKFKEEDDKPDPDKNITPDTSGTE